MSRTTVEQVKKILPASTALECDEISEAIAAATALVDSMVLRSGGDLLSDPVLLQVEKYLSGHFSAVTENTLSLKSEKSPCGSGSATYGFSFGTGILGTPYGQMANSLSGGRLAEMDKRPISIESIGCI